MARSSHVFLELDRLTVRFACFSPSSFSYSPRCMCLCVCVCVCHVACGAARFSHSASVCVCVRAREGVRCTDGEQRVCKTHSV